MSDLVDRAEAAIRRLDGGAALALYEGPANGVPEDQVLVGKVRALWLLRRWAAAHETCDVLCDRFPNSVHAAIARGVIALGQPDEPTMVGLMYQAARRDDAEAVAAFTEAVRLDTTSDLAVAGLSSALRMAGQLDEAEQVLADRLADTEPSNEILFARAAVAIDRDHVDEAREYLDRMIAADPFDYRAVVRYVALDRITWGCRLDDLGVERPTASLLEHRAWRDAELAAQSKGAERERLLALADAGFAESVETGPVLPGALCGRIYVAELRGNRSGAGEFIAHGLAQERDSRQLRFEQAKLVESPEGRCEELRGLSAEDPRDLIVHIELAYELNSQGRADEARSVLADLTEQLPDRRDLIRANAWFDVVDGFPERSLAGFRRLGRADPNAIAGEIGALRMLGAIEQAEALYDEAAKLKLTGSPAGMKLEYAYCAMHEGRYGQVEERVRAVLAIDPANTAAEQLRIAAQDRATRRWWQWWRPEPNDARALELARSEHPKARVRAELVPEGVRERTLGRLRVLEWELAKLRAGEENAVRRQSVRTDRLINVVGLVALLAGLAGPWWVWELFGHSGFIGWRWPVLALPIVVVGLWWLDVGSSRPRAILALAALLPGAVAYLWWRGWHFDGFWDTVPVAGVLLPMILASAATLLDLSLGTGTGGLDRPARRVRWRRRQAGLRRRYPFASMLLDLEELALLLGDEHAMATGGARERCARLFESAAMAADHLIRRARTEHFEDDTRPAAWLYQPQPYWARAWLRPLAGYPDALLEQRLNRCAASVVTQLRQYKRQVLLPGDGTWARLREEVVRFAALACERRWDSLPQPEPENAVGRLRARLAVSMRLLLTAAVGPAALVAYEVLPGKRPDVPAAIAIALYAGWPLLTIMMRLDPDLVAKLNVLGPWLPGAARSGGDQDQRGASAPAPTGKK